MRILELLIRSRFWVGVAAAAMTAEFQYFFLGGFNFFAVLQTFFVTAAAYLFLDESELANKALYIRISLLGSFLFTGLNGAENFWALLAGVVLVLTYRRLTGIPGLSKLHLEWRRIPVVKNLVIALCWIFVTSCQFATKDIISDHLLRFWIADGLFIFALSIIEDIADIGVDNVKTLAVISVSVARMTAAASIGVSFLLLSGGYYGFSEFAMILCVLQALGAIALGLLLKTGLNRNLSGFVIDGMIVSKFLVWLL